MQDLPLTAYPDDPIYNMKAVTQRTGIPAATLRAWERRYRALAPRRSKGNYRLYSERDIAVLRWLQTQLGAGLSISRAVALLERMRDRDSAATAVPGPGESESGEPAHGGAEGRGRLAAHAAASLEQLGAALHDALMALEEQRAGLILAEAFALYAIEDVCTQLIAPTLVLIGDEWFSRQVTVVQEHFASAYLMGRLLSLFNAQPLARGPLILVACAPTERHELGALMLALLLRRAGHHVRYLGADVPLADLVTTIHDLRPHVVALSAMMPQAANLLADLSVMLQDTGVRTHLVFGGGAFILDDSLRTQLNGSFIGTDIPNTITAIEQLLHSEAPMARVSAA